MNTAYVILMCIGSLILAIITSYSMWFRVRTKRLQLDILSIRLQLRRKVRSLKGLDDTAFRKTDELLATLVSRPELMSWVPVMYFLVEAQKRPRNRILASSPALQQVIDAIRKKVDNRIAFHLIAETMLGWGILVVCIVILRPISVVKKFAGKVDGVFDDIESLAALRRAAYG